MFQSIAHTGAISQGLTIRTMSHILSKLSAVAVLFTMFLPSHIEAVDADGIRHDVDLFGGVRNWHDEAWAGLDNGWIAGVRYQLRKVDVAFAQVWPVSLEASYALTGSSDQGFDLFAQELSVGLLKSWQVSKRTEWSVAGGVAYTMAQLENTDVGFDESDQAWSGYGRAALRFRLERLRLGAQLQYQMGGHYSFGQNSDADASALDVVAVLGYEF